MDIQASGDKIKHKEIWKVPNINLLNCKAGKLGESKITVFWLKIVCSVVADTNVLEGPASSIFRAEEGILRRGSRFLPNIGTYPSVKLHGTTVK